MNSIIFISGFGRSGSSIFEKYLSSKYNCFSVGELSFFLERFLLYKEPCSCGKNIFNCEFWSEVIKCFDIELLLKNIQYYIEISNYFESISRFPYFLSNRCKINPDLLNYTKLQREIYFGVSKILNDTKIIIVENSKNPSRALWLSTMDDINSYTIHLFRNPIANSFSWTKKKIRLRSSNYNQPIYMIKRNYWQAMFRWYQYNIFSYLLKYIYKENYVRINYEKFIISPEKEVLINKNIKSVLNSNHKPQMLGYHSISGNPSRLEDNVNLVLDNEWKKKVSLKKKFLSYLLCYPFYLLLKYR